jgi:hypothetical protein
MNLNLLIPPTASPRPNSRAQSRAVGGGPMGGPGSDGNVNQMFKDRFGNINTAKVQIEK